MTNTFYFTTEMPTESFDELVPDQSVILKREAAKSGRHSDLAATLDPAEELECRIALLEVAFQNYALEIRDKMAARMAKLEEKLAHQNSELRDALREESADRKDAIQDFSDSVANAIDRVESAVIAG